MTTTACSCATPQLPAARRDGDAGDVLLVDDTPANLALVTSVLKENGYRVRAVPSGALALRAAQAKMPDLVLLDVLMPDMDGFETCRRLKSNPKLRGVPVIFLTADSEPSDKVKGFSVGGVDYVTKPFQLEELAARVRTHVSLRRLEQDVESQREELAATCARLRSLEDRRQRLTHMIVHDLKGPISAAYYSALFVRDARRGIDEDVAEAMQDVVASIRVVNRMTLDMLDVAASEQGRLTPRLELVDVRELLEQTVSEMRGAAQHARQRVSIEASLSAKVSADRELLRRVLENLLDNSIKYAPDGTEIRIEAALAGRGQFAIRVRDHGPGIPIAQRERIFEAYARLERDARRHERMSRGLGLAFCRLAVEAHQGRIWVEDNQPCGTTFVVQLPVAPAAGAVQDRPATEPGIEPSAEPPQPH